MSSVLPKDPAKLAAIARSPETTIGMLQTLAKSDLMFLREDVARHPKATPKLLDELVPDEIVSDSKYGVAKTVAANPKASSRTLLSLLKLVERGKLGGNRRENWRYEDLALAVLRHPNLPAPAALSFLRETDLSRKRKVQLAKQTAQEQVLHMLASDKSEIVRDAARKCLEILGQSFSDL